MTDKHPNGWEVGMTVYVVLDRRNMAPPTEAEITKIGRKWIYFGYGSRFDADTMRIDGGQYQSRGRVWLSRAEYAEQTEIAKSWLHLYRRLGSIPPRGMTLARIAELEAELVNEKDAAG